MALHQYIGARYVPYYYENSLDPTSTEWEPNVNYEALTVVTLPNQHSYISKKFVPDTVGTPAANADYWLDTGSNDAYIQALQDQIDDMNDGSIPGSLQYQIDHIQMNDVHSYHWLIITDSYGMEPTLTDAFSQKLIDYLGLAASEYEIIIKNGGGIGGGSFVTAAGETTLDDSKPVKVIIAGGFNDATYFDNGGSFGTFITNIQAINTTLAGKFSNFEVLCAFIAYESSATEASRTNAIAFGTACEGYKLSSRFGWRYITGSEYLLHNNNLDSSGFHPTAAGAIEIATGLATGIFTGACPSYIAAKNLSNFLTYNISGATATHVRGDIRQIINGPIGTIYIDDWYFTLSTGISVAANTFLPIATIPDLAGLFLNSKKYSKTTGVCRISVNGVVQTFCAQIVFDGNQIGIIGPDNLSNCDAFILNGIASFDSRAPFYY